MSAKHAIAQQMKEKLSQSGIAFKNIECYGSQIVITSYCRDSADKWALLLTRFAKVRGVIESLDEAKANKNTVLLPTTTKVWRTFAAI